MNDDSICERHYAGQDLGEKPKPVEGKPLTDDDAEEFSRLLNRHGA